MHKVIWDEFEEKDFVLPQGKDRILASYETGGVQQPGYSEQPGCSSR